MPGSRDEIEFSVERSTSFSMRLRFRVLAAGGEAGGLPSCSPSTSLESEYLRQTILRRGDQVSSAGLTFKCPDLTGT